MVSEAATDWRRLWRHLQRVSWVPAIVAETGFATMKRVNATAILSPESQAVGGGREKMAVGAVPMGAMALLLS